MIFFSQAAIVDNLFDIVVVRKALLVSIRKLFTFYLLRSLLAWKIVTANELKIEKGFIIVKLASGHSWSFLIQKQLLGP